MDWLSDLRQGLRKPPCIQQLKCNRGWLVLDVIIPFEYAKESLGSTNCRGFNGWLRDY
jgi:hypothetical protein